MYECPSCGAEVKASDKRCSKCGADLTKKTNSSSKLIIGVVAVIVIVAIVGAFASGVFNTNAPGTVVKDNSEVETVHPVSDNNSDSNSSANTEYWASAKAEKFHTPDCEWAQKISDNNKVIYHSREDAIEDGKVPCGVCNP